MTVNFTQVKFPSIGRQGDVSGTWAIEHNGGDNYTISSWASPSYTIPPKQLPAFIQQAMAFGFRQGLPTGSPESETDLEKNDPRYKEVLPQSREAVANIVGALHQEVDRRGEKLQKLEWSVSPASKNGVARATATMYTYKDKPSEASPLRLTPVIYFREHADAVNAAFRRLGGKSITGNTAKLPSMTAVTMMRSARKAAGDSMPVVAGQPIERRVKQWFGNFEGAEHCMLWAGQTARVTIKPDELDDVIRRAKAQGYRVMGQQIRRVGKSAKAETRPFKVGDVVLLPAGPSGSGEGHAYIAHLYSLIGNTASVESQGPTGKRLTWRVNVNNLRPAPGYIYKSKSFRKSALKMEFYAFQQALCQAIERSIIEMKGVMIENGYITPQATPAHEALSDVLKALARAQDQVMSIRYSLRERPDEKQLMMKWNPIWTHLANVALPLVWKLEKMGLRAATGVEGRIRATLDLIQKARSVAVEFNAGMRKSSTKSLYDTIRGGDTVVISTPQGGRIRGRAVIHGPHGWVLNTGGRYGNTAIADARNTIQVIPFRGNNRPAAFDFRRSVSKKFISNHKQWRVGNHLVQTWYDNERVERVDPTNQVRPFVLKTDAGLPQSFTTELARTKYLEWIMGLWKSQGKSAKNGGSNQALSQLQSIWVELLGISQSLGSGLPRATNAKDNNTLEYMRGTGQYFHGAITHIESYIEDGNNGAALALAKAMLDRLQEIKGQLPAIVERETNPQKQHSYAFLARNVQAILPQFGRMVQLLQTSKSMKSPQKDYIEGLLLKVEPLVSQADRWASKERSAAIDAYVRQLHQLHRLLRQNNPRPADVLRQAQAVEAASQNPPSGIQRGWPFVYQDIQKTVRMAELYGHGQETPGVLHTEMPVKLNAYDAYWVELDHSSKLRPNYWVRGNGYPTERDAIQAAQRAFLPSRIVYKGRVIRQIESKR